MQCGLETHQDTFLSIGSRPHFWIFNKTLSSKPSTVSSKTPRENSTLKMRRLHIEGEGSCLGPLICTVCSEMGLMKLLKKQPLGLWKYMRFDVSLCLQLNVLLLSVLCSRIRWILGYFIFFTMPPGWGLNPTGTSLIFLLLPCSVSFQTCSHVSIKESSAYLWVVYNNKQGKGNIFYLSLADCDVGIHHYIKWQIWMLMFHNHSGLLNRSSLHFIINSNTSLKYFTSKTNYVELKELNGNDQSSHSKAFGVI